ncbi:MAG TPA: hypothetical protein VE709_00515 [Pseudonocardiaceae bacterium]|nr:hypothetical protein [Pseudonocardiaceae bacterium]
MSAALPERGRLAEGAGPHPPLDIVWPRLPALCAVGVLPEVLSGTRIGVL